MAIIKCDDVIEEVEIAESTGSATTTVEPYVEQDEVSLGKTLLAVEGTSFSPSTPFVDVLPEVRNTDISDTLRADAGLYWYLSDEGKMVHPILGYILPSVQLRSTITMGSNSRRNHRVSSNSIGATRTDIFRSRISDEYSIFQKRVRDVHKYIKRR